MEFKKRMSFIQYLFGFIYNEMRVSKKISPDLLPLINPSSLQPVKCLDFDIDNADLRKGNKIKRNQVKQQPVLKEEEIMYDFV